MGVSQYLEINLPVAFGLVIAKTQICVEYKKDLERIVKKIEEIVQKINR